MSFYTALTGLNGSSADISATSNNIANVGTTGFKRSRAEFGDIFATSPLQNASSSIGSGTILKGIKQQFTQGNIAASLNALDLAISGQGFFALKPSLTSTQTVYTRNGSLNVNNDRYVVDSAGQFLLVYPVNDDGSVTAKDLISSVPLQLPVTSGDPKATSLIQLGVNVPAAADVVTDRPEFAEGYTFNTNDPNSFTNSTSITIFDDLGNPTIATIYFIKTQSASAEDPTNKYNTKLVINDTVVDPDLVPSVDDSGNQIFIDRFGMQTTTVPDDNYFLEGKGSALYKQDSLRTLVPSEPASLRGEGGANLGFDFGEEGDKLVEIVTDPTQFNATRESGDTDSKIYWGTNFLSVNVDDSDQPVNIDIRPGKYNAAQLASEVERSINEAYGDDKKIQVVQNVDDSLNINLFKLNADGSSTGLTTTIGVDLLADSYVSTVENISLTGASPDFTREQFLAHSQARINTALNSYASTSSNATVLGVNNKLFGRTVGTKMDAILTETQIVNLRHMTSSNSTPSTASTSSSDKFMVYSYQAKKPNLSVYDNRTQVASSGNTVVFDSTQNTLTVNVANASNISANEKIRIAGEFLTTDSVAKTHLNGREFTVTSVTGNTVTINTTGLSFPESGFTLTENDIFVMSDESTTVEAFFEGAQNVFEGAKVDFSSEKIVIREIGTTTKHAYYNSGITGLGMIGNFTKAGTMTGNKSLYGIGVGAIPFTTDGSTATNMSESGTAAVTKTFTEIGVGAVTTGTVAGTSAATSSTNYADIASTRTSGNGRGAVFDVTANGSGAYTVTIENPGVGYAATDTITIDGASLGGVSGTNDLTFTVGAVVGSTNGSGTNASFSIACAGGSYTATVVNPGAGYADGNTITIPGTALGGATPANDLVLTIPASTVDNSTSGSGVNGTFDITIASGVITDMKVRNAGSGYASSNTITLKGTTLGGTDSTNDLTVTLGSPAGIFTVDDSVFDVTQTVGGSSLDSLDVLGLRSTSDTDATTTSTDWVDEKAPPVKISYNETSQNLEFTVDRTVLGTGTDSNFNSFTVFGATGATSTNNLGIPNKDDSIETLIRGGEVLRTDPLVADGEEIQLNDKRFGVDVTYNTDTKSFSISSGTTGEQIDTNGALNVPNAQKASNIAVGRFSLSTEDGSIITGATAFSGDNHLMGFGVTKTDAVFTAGKGLAATPAKATGTAATDDLSEVFRLSNAGGENIFNVSVNGINGIIEIPTGFYVGSTLAEALENRINQIMDPTSGDTVGGVTVKYIPGSNNFEFTTGTAGDTSTIKVKGASRLGLADVPLGVGSIPKIYNLEQATDENGVKLFVDANGKVVTTPPANLVDGYFPLYIDEGELTFDKTGKLLSPSNLVHYEKQEQGFSIDLNIDFGSSTQFAQPFSVLSVTQDGFTSGRLDGLEIDASGTIRANYTNGQNNPLGKIVLANFNNQNGLKQIGNATYSETAVSGAAQVGEAGAEGFGTILSGSLERSNVDITEELVNLITAQRNFQASAKAIETTTTLTQTIINIRM